MKNNIWYADVILPLPLPVLYTYAIPENIINKIGPGKRVIIQFGNKKIYSAIVKKIHQNPPPLHKIKSIISVLDEDTLISPLQFEFWEWLSDYYLCSEGEILKAALPSGLKLESETRIIARNDFSNFSSLHEKERLILRLINTDEALSINEIIKSFDDVNIIRFVNKLFAKGAIVVEEKLKPGYSERQESYIIHNKKLSENDIHKILDNLAKAPKQHKLLSNYIRLSEMFSGKAIKPVAKKKLLEITGAGHASINSLEQKEILYTYKKSVSRLHEVLKENILPNKLDKKQKECFNNIQNLFLDKNVVLLHGITSSGKTEIYIHLIQKQLNEGKQVLYLLPEIALSTQIIIRLKNIFGNRIGVYHSKFSDSERVEIWNNVRSNNNDSYQIVLGVRSSVFLPFKNLGLIIIDEEHENTYKQYDPSPRYNARDAAIVLARIHGAKTLLGTATPSIESYYNAKTGKYGFVELLSRYGNIPLPEVILADTKEARRKKKMRSIFTPQLLEGIKSCLENNEQIILFQNRRGYSPYLECEECGWIPKCNYCDVNQTYHKYVNQLVCHYCGTNTKVNISCQKCNNNLIPKGSGTEKIEDEIKLFFPDARIARMDLDSTRSKKAFGRIIHDFQEKKTNILIGTQMVSKGFDFEGVSLTGIINADNILNFPDFRSFERSYQLMVQVSGRAGRKSKPGKVIIQTSDPEHHIIKDIVSNNYIRMFNKELNDRKEFNYPPYSRLVKIYLKHKDKNTVHKASIELVSMLSSYFGNMVLGPETPIINRFKKYPY
ncbi:primosomal protein N' [Bacteroidota bacterium]